MDIYPSILQKSAADVLHLMTITEHMFEHVQIDIADNTYTKTSTCSIAEIAQGCIDAQYHTQTTIELHLMVENIEQHINMIEQLHSYIPVREVFVHLEPAIRWTKGHEEDLNRLLHTHFPYSFGIVVSPHVSIREHVATLLPFETIQIMTVEPGTQGSPFLPEQLKKITQLRELGYNGRIVLDGGISPSTLPIILAQPYWPDSVCPGSFFASHPLSMRHAAEELYETVVEAEERKIDDRV